MTQNVRQGGVVWDLERNRFWQYEAVSVQPVRSPVSRQGLEGKERVDFVLGQAVSSGHC